MGEKRITIRIDEKKKYSYGDAIVSKAHDDSYDLIFPNGRIKKYVPNASTLLFNSGDKVSVLFSNEERTDCRIIGKGRRTRKVYLEQVKMVEV